MNSGFRRLAILAGITFIFSAILALAACSPHASGKADEDAGGQPSSDGTAINVAWSPDSDCATCHRAEADSQIDSACLASIHASSQCVDCHNDESGLATQHEKATADAKAPTRLKKTEVVEGTCLGCHGSYEMLAEKTETYTGLADKNGTVVNPHAIPESTDHQDITCTNCHEIHVADADVEKGAMKTCTTCHHEEVFECGTCHNQ